MKGSAALLASRRFQRARHGMLSIVVVLSSWNAPASACAAGPDNADRPGDARRPNIILIMADDLGWTDLGSFGSDYYETPAIDRLASQGIRFTNHHHCPNCAPTRAAIMSGQHGARTGIYTVGNIDRFDWSMRPLVPVENVTRLPLDRRTIADSLKAAGYATAMFGKWHLGNDKAHHPSARGFDEAIESSGRHKNFETDPPVRVPEETYLADFRSTGAGDLSRRHAARPFFLYLPHFAVHAPHQAKPAMIERFSDKPAARGHHNPTYAAMIASLDQSVGRIMASLDELSLADDTLLIFTSDNGGVGGYRGEGLGEKHDTTDNAPLRSGKGSLYEGGLRVPLIIRWPGIVSPGRSCNEPTQHIDFYPTLLEATGARPPSHRLDGESLMPLLSGSAASLERTAIFQHFPGYLGIGPNRWRTTPVSVVQEGHWKLMEFLEDGRLELYNLDHDIGESENLAASEPERASRMQRRLVDWRREVNAPLPKRADAKAATGGRARIDDGRSTPAHGQNPANPKKGRKERQRVDHST
ncbi:MAG: sulfatase [Planctomycetaceae bacterium]